MKEPAGTVKEQENTVPADLKKINENGILSIIVTEKFSEAIEKYFEENMRQLEERLYYAVINTKHKTSGNIYRGVIDYP